MIEQPVGRSYLIDREGKIVAEVKTGIGPLSWLGLGLLGLGSGGCTAAGKLSESDTQARDRLFWISAAVFALGFLLIYMGDALGRLRWWMKRGRGAVDPLYSGRWFDIPPTPRSSDPPSQPGSERRSIHPLEMIEELSRSDEDGGDDGGGDGDSD